MASSALIKWNTRYAQAGRKIPTPPAALIAAVPYLRPGKLLDIACGEGAVALFLAQLAQFEVSALDISDIGLANLEQFAKDKNLHLSTLCVDLDGQGVDQLAKFENICIFRYKPSVDLILKLSDKLTFGGRLIISTFNQRQHIEHGFASRFCLQDHEFDDVGADLEPLAYLRSNSAPFTDTYIFQKI